MHGLVDGPVLVAGGLQHEDVMDVVVGIEAAAVRRGDIGVGLYGVSQIIDHAPNEVDKRWP